MAGSKRSVTIDIAGEDRSAGKAFKGVGTDAEQLAAKLKQTEAQLNRALSGMGAGAGGLGTKLRGIGDDARRGIGDVEGQANGLASRLGLAGSEGGRAFGDRFADEASGRMESVGDDLMGTLTDFAVAGGIGAAFMESIESEVSADRLAATLGLGAQEAEAAGRVAGSLYSNAYGDSMSDVNSAIGAVHSSLGEFIGDSEAGLESATAKAMDLASGFEMDVAESAQLAGVAIRHGLADDADHAFDLITAAMQRMPTQMRGELFPAIEEYGDELAAMGFTGEEAFGLLAAASQDGMYGIDKTGDAIKELSIRATDMSTTSVAAYEAAGLSADDMSRRFLAGGETARGALGDLVDGLLGIQDPVTRANAAIALFGTPIEDLGVTQIPAFLSSLTEMGSDLGDVTGKADEFGAVLNDNLKTNLTSISRDAMAPLVTIAETLSGVFTSMPGPAQDAVAGIAGIGTAAVPVVWGLGKVLDGGRAVLDWATNFATPAGTVSDAMNGMERSTSRFGAALAIAGRVGVLAGLAEGLGQIGDAIVEVDDADIPKLENDLLRFGRSGRVGAELAALAGEDLDKLGGAVNRLAEPSNLQAFTDAWTRNVPLVGGTTRGFEEAQTTIENLDAALAQMAQRDPAAASAAFDAITASLEEQGVPAERINGLFTEYDSTLASIDTQELVAGQSAANAEMGEGAIVGGVLDNVMSRLTGTATATGAALDHAATPTHTIATEGLAEAMGVLSSQTATASEKADGYRLALDSLFAGQLGRYEATVAWSGAIAGLTQSFVDNGLTLDMNTEAGRANHESVIGAAQAAIDHADAVYRETGSLELANSTITGHIGQLRAEMIQAGLTQEQVDWLTASINLTPESIQTAFAAHTASANQNVDGIQRNIESTPYSWLSRFNADTGSANAQVDSLQSNIRATDRSIDIWVRVHETREALTFGWASPRAEGGPVSMGQLYLVGEEGPEFFVPNQPGTVIPHGMTAAAMSGGTGVPLDGGGDLVVNFGPVVAQLERNRLDAWQVWAETMAAEKERHIDLREHLGPMLLYLRLIKSEADLTANGIETLIMQNAWGASNVRWFEDLAGMHKLQRFHDGGIVPGPPGAEVPILAKAGEVVADPDDLVVAGTGGGSTVVMQFDFRGSVGLDTKAFEEAAVTAVNRALGAGKVNVRGRRLT